MVNALPAGAVWTSFGISRMQMPWVAQAAVLGGNVRVGLEDNFYLPSGKMVSSNGELVGHAVKMAADVGRTPATVDETKQILGLETVR